MPSARSALPDLVGGWACLDLANTLGPRRPESGAEPPHDYIPGYPELVTWAAHAGLLTADQQRRLTAAAAADPGAAAAVHRDALRLREASYETFSALAQDQPAPAAGLATIQDAYLAALRAAHLGPVTGGLDWRWPDDDNVRRVLWPLARSAADLATSDQLGRIKQCPGDDGRCGWLFADTSKNASRRWCSMRTCGSRLKSRRQVARLRAAH